MIANPKFYPAWTMEPRELHLKPTLRNQHLTATLVAALCYKGDPDIGEEPWEVDEPLMTSYTMPLDTTARTTHRRDTINVAIIEIHNRYEEA